MVPIAIVILAAGTSSRMGQPKLLLEWNGRSLVHHAAETALAASPLQVVVVTGPRDAEMRADLEGLPLSMVHNPSFAEGMSTSLRAGIEQVVPQAQGALIMLGDQPLLPRSVVRALVEALTVPGARIVQPRYGGTPGNPVGFSRALFPALCQQEGDQGARALIRTHRDEITYLDFDEPDAQRDIDTPEDYAAIATREQR